MPMIKNQIFEVTVENLSSDGNGVAHVEGQAIFVPGTAPGDVIACRIVKPMKSYAFGRMERLIVPARDASPRTAPYAPPAEDAGCVT